MHAPEDFVLGTHSFALGTHNKSIDDALFLQHLKCFAAMKWLICVLQDGEVPSQFRDADSAKEAQLLETWKAYKKGFQEGISIFNKKPKKGISFLQVRP